MFNSASSNYFSRITRNYAVIIELTAYHSPGTDHAVISEYSAFEYDRITTDEAVSAYMDLFGWYQVCSVAAIFSP